VLARGGEGKTIIGKGRGVDFHVLGVPFLRRKTGGEAKHRGGSIRERAGIRSNEQKWVGAGAKVFRGRN